LFLSHVLIVFDHGLNIRCLAELTAIAIILGILLALRRMIFGLGGFAIGHAPGSGGRWNMLGALLGKFLIGLQGRMLLNVIFDLRKFSLNH
jgi:hypothetical protein